MVERERMESMTRASLNGYAVTARIEYGHGRSPLPYRRLHGLVRFAKLLRPCPNNLLNTIHSPLLKTAWACSLRETATPVPALL